MKAGRVVLVVSLAANVAALAAFALRPAATTAYFRTVWESPKTNHAAPVSGAPTGAQATGTSSGSTATADIAGVRWSDLPMEDLPALVARLRASGMSPGVVRAIVTTLVSESYSARRRELMRDRMPAEYWRNPRAEDRNMASELALRDLNREQEKRLRELLGSDYNRTPLSDDWMTLNHQRQFGGLPPPKVAALQQIDADYRELMTKVHEESLGVMLPEDRAKLALLEKEKRADLERLFTPEELLEYELRNSPASHNLRSRLSRFDATEEEFRALFSSQRSLPTHVANDGPMDQQVAQQRAAAVDAEFRRVLGEARYAEFKKANEPVRGGLNVDQLTRLATRLNLPPSTAASVVAVHGDMQARAAVVTGNRALSPEERNGQLAALANEATARLSQTLTPRGLEAYRQNGGQWLQTLARPVAPTAQRPAAPK